MSFQYDATGVSMDGPLLPNQKFTFRIMEAEEGTTKENRYPLVKVRADVVNDPEFSGWPVFHYVTFMPKEKPGAGIAVHFLKTIGEPYEGTFDVHPDNWIGKTFQAQVTTEEYQGRKNNKFKNIEPAKADDGLPF